MAILNQECISVLSETNVYGWGDHWKFMCANESAITQRNLLSFLNVEEVRKQRSTGIEFPVQIWNDQGISF